MEESKAEHSLFVTSVIVQTNKVRFNDTNALDKTISVGESNNAGVSRSIVLLFYPA